MMDTPKDVPAVMDHTTRRAPRRPRRAPVRPLEALESRLVLSTTTPTTVTLSVPGAPATAGDPLPITALVRTDGVGDPGEVDGGTVTFREGSVVLGTAPVVAGAAAIRPANLGPGVHRITASYGGFGRFGAGQTAVDGTGIITTYAGTRSPVGLPDGSPATLVTLANPQGIAFDGAGNLYIADGGGDTVRKVTPGGIMTTFAGRGPGAFSGDGGPATSAFLDYPSAVAADAAGNVYIADTFNNRVRKVAPDGTITTVAGGGFTQRDGVPATDATLQSPGGLALDGAGNLYIADTANNRVRMVAPDGTITTVAGTGVAGSSGDGGQATDATLNNPYGVAVDAAGSVYIADTANGSVRRVTPDGVITRVAGTGVAGTVPSDSSGDGGPASAATLVGPVALTFDAAGNLFVADLGARRVRRVTPGGVITTVAGIGQFDSTGEGGPAQEAAVFLPRGVATDPAGNLSISETFGPLVRRVTATADVEVRPRFAITGLDAPIISGRFQALTITAVDADGNPVRDFNGTVRLANSIPTRLYPWGKPYPAEPDQEVNLVNGVGTVEVIFRTTGPQTLSITDPGNAAATSTRDINVVPGPIEGFRLDGPTGPVRGSDPVEIRITPRDGWGNIAKGQTLPIIVTTSDPLAQLPPSLAGRYGLDTDLSDGFGFVNVRFGTPGPQTITIVMLGGDGVAFASVTGTVNVDVEPVTPGKIYLNPYGGLYYGSAFESLAGRTVYIDANNNGRLDDGEVTALSDADGNFTLAGIARADAPIRDAGDRSPGYRNNVTAMRDDGRIPASVNLVPTSAVAPLPGYPDVKSIANYTDPASDYVRTLYRAVLGRDGSEPEVATWVAGLNAGQTREEVSSQFVNSPEHRRQQVDSYYRTFLKRDADVFSQVWVDQLRSGVSEADVAASILASDEYRALHRDDASFVAALYQDGLGRDVDTAGRVDGAAALAGGLDRVTLARRVLGSEEAIDQILDGFYAGYLHRPKDATASDWAATLRRRGNAVSTVAAGILASVEFYEITVPKPVD